VDCSSWFGVIEIVLKISRTQLRPAGKYARVATLWKGGHHGQGRRTAGPGTVLLLFLSFYDKNYNDEVKQNFAIFHALNRNSSQ
jgi:hypothetical protein